MISAMISHKSRQSNSFGDALSPQSDMERDLIPGGCSEAAAE